MKRTNSSRFSHLSSVVVCDGVALAIEIQTIMFCQTRLLALSLSQYFSVCKFSFFCTLFNCHLNTKERELKNFNKHLAKILLFYARQTLKLRLLRQKAIHHRHNNYLSMKTAYLLCFAAKRKLCGPHSHICIQHTEPQRIRLSGRQTVHVFGTHPVRQCVQARKRIRIKT